MYAGPPRRFKSHAHPGAASWHLTYTRALVRPVAVCLLPVMVATLTAALQGFVVQPYVWGGAGAALGLASLWTTFRLQRTVAEIHVAGGEAAVRSVWDCVRTVPPAWEPVFDLRDYRSWCFATVGLSSYELEAADWPDYDALRDALKEARDAAAWAG